MRATELRKMEPFFTELRDIRQFMVDAAAAAGGPAAGCDCEIGTDGRWQFAGRCLAVGRDLADGKATGALPRHCRAVAHLAARAKLNQLRLPTNHLSDPQLDTVLGAVVSVADRAPQLTQREFVIQIQEALRASLAFLVQDAGADDSEDPAQ